MHEQKAEIEAPASGREARRRFLKNSSGVAVAVPAAVLLLSVSRANADTAGGYGDIANPVPR